MEEFVDLLERAQVACVVDVRTAPRSRTNPQYNRDTLPQTLAAVSIGYEHIASLGGLRSRKREIPPETNQVGRQFALSPELYYAWHMVPNGPGYASDNLYMVGVRLNFLWYAP